MFKNSEEAPLALRAAPPHTLGCVRRCDQDEREVECANTSGGSNSLHAHHRQPLGTPAGSFGELGVGEFVGVGGGTGEGEGARREIDRERERERERESHEKPHSRFAHHAPIQWAM